MVLMRINKKEKHQTSVSKGVGAYWDQAGVRGAFSALSNEERRIRGQESPRLQRPTSGRQDTPRTSPVAASQRSGLCRCVRRSFYVWVRGTSLLCSCLRLHTTSSDSHQRQFFELASLEKCTISHAESHRTITLYNLPRSCHPRLIRLPIAPGA